MKKKTKTQNIEAVQSHRIIGSDYSVSNKCIWNLEAETSSSVLRVLVAWVGGHQSIFSQFI